MDSVSLWKRQSSEVHEEQKKMDPSSYSLITQVRFPTTVALGQKRFWKCQGPEKAGLTWTPSKEATARSPWKHILSSDKTVEEQLVGRLMYTLYKLTLCDFTAIDGLGGDLMLPKYDIRSQGTGLKRCCRCPLLLTRRDGSSCFNSLTSLL